MNLNLKGKTVVITGGAEGIGKSTAAAFLAEGCNVAICGRTQSKLDNFLQDFAGNPVLTVQADVAIPDDMEKLASAVAASFGGIDIWINNAGIYPGGYLADMPLDVWHKTFDINVSGVLYGSRAAIPYLKQRGGGVIVNAASFATIIPTAGRGAYGITKAAVSHMTKVLGAELAPDNIRVVAYMPGFVMTELTTAVIGEYQGDGIKRQLAQHRYGTPEDIAPVILFLASDAAGFITGCGVEISGGKYCVQNPYAPWERAEEN